MKLHFVLVKPSHPGNVGACARALKTMGFDSLRLVESSAHRESRARWLAHGSHDILDQAAVYPNLAEAIADCELVIGTTARMRSSRRVYHSMVQIREALANKGETVGPAAILFGCEESGLSNRELTYCDLLSHIPLAVSHPSLNLSQAVMIYAYELSYLNGSEHSQMTAPDSREFKNLKGKCVLVLKQLELTNHRKLPEWLNDRLGLLASRDIKMLHVLTNALLNRL